MDKSGSKAGGAPGSTGSAKNSMTPGFRGGAGGGEKTAGLSASGASARNEKGAATLGAGEAVAAGAVSSDFDTSEDLLDETREGEENAEGYYSGNGGEDGEEERNVFALKKGPIATIIGFILFLGGLMGLAQVSQPFSLAEQLRTQFNSMQTSAATRSNNILKFQLDNKLMKNPTKLKLFSKEGKFSISGKQKTKLSANGIEIEDVDGTKVMRYQGADGRPKIVVANESEVEGFKAKFQDADVTTFKQAFEYDSDFFVKYKSASMTWRGAIANWFESGTMKFLSENKLTRNLFKNFKDEVAENGGDAKKTALELSSKGTDELEGGGTKLMTSKEDMEDDNGKIGKSANAENPGASVTDDNGKITVSGTTTEDAGTSTNISRKTQFDSEAKVKAYMEDVGAKYKKGPNVDTGGGIAGTVQMATNTGCLIAGFIGAVNMLVVADEVLQAVHYAMGYNEAVAKAQAGDDQGELNAMMANMNVVETSMHKVLEASFASKIAEGVGNIIINLTDSQNGRIDGLSDELRNNLTVGDSTTNTGNSFRNGPVEMNGVAEALNNNLTVEEKYTTGSAMDSEGITSLYSGGKVNPDDPSIRQFNFARSYRTIAGALGVSTGSFYACTSAKILANAFGVVESAIKTGSCIAGLAAAAASYGVSAVLGCFGLAKDLVQSVVLGIGATTIISALVTILTPVVSQLLMKNFAGMMGVDLGNITWFGTQWTYGNVAQANGNSIMTKEKYAQFAMAQQEVIAEDARYDQLTKSPLDASSEYTFMGNLMRQLNSFVGSNSILKTIGTAGTTLGNSIIALTPAATAYGLTTQIYDDYYEICPELDSIGAVGSAVCIPYHGTDMDTIADAPDDVVARLAEGDNFMRDESGELQLNEDGNVIIRADSGLADYIEYAVGRTSAFGVADQNIVNKVSSEVGTVDTESTAFNNVANGTIGAIPFVGDTFDVINNSKALANAGYVTGESLVAGNDVTYGVNWEEAKDYQRFIEDQALFETMGILDEEGSAVTAYQNKYREENPLDNSYEGILARYSGLEKEDVEGILGVLEYVNYIANYNPSERYAFSQEVKPEGADELKFDNDQKVAYVVLLNTIEFADVRNRNFVV